MEEAGQCLTGDTSPFGRDDVGAVRRDDMEGAAGIVRRNQLLITAGRSFVTKAAWGTTAPDQKGFVSGSMNPLCVAFRLP